MTGLPTLTVELEDGSGNFTNDITGYVRKRTFTLTRGWSDENDEDSIQPAILKLALDNSDGKFTLGASNFNGITKHKRIRLSETVGGTTYRRCVGYVVDWPTEWESALGNTAIASIVASDRFARLNRRKLRSITEHEILLDTPAAYYTLGEEAGSTSAGDTSGNSRPSLAFAGTGTLPVFGSASFNTWEDGTTCTVTASGQALTNAAAFATSSTSLTLECEAAFTAVGLPSFLASTQYPSLNGVGLWVDVTGHVSAVDITGSGSLVNPVATSPGAYNDGLAHVFAVTVSGTTWTLYADGSAVASGAGSVILSGQTMMMTAGGYISASASTPALVAACTLGKLAAFTTNLSAARLAAHANAVRNGFNTDTADQRIARLLSYANVATADQNLETGLQSAMAAQSTSGQSVLDALQDVAQSEGGGVFIQGDGKFTFHNKSHRVIRATGTPAITVTVDLVDPDMTWASDNYLFNTATGTRNGGAQQRSVNSVSVGKYEEWPTTRDNALLPSDELVLNELTWVTTMYGEPLSRLSSVTFDLQTLPQATVQALLALELGDLMRITGWPAQSPASSVDLIIEGSEEKQTEVSWKITFNTAPGSLFRAWILGDSTYSVLGSTTRLYL